MKNRFDNFSIRPCSPGDLEEILRIQDETFETLPDPDFLRKNTPEMLLECLGPPHYTLGAWHGGGLAAFAILYDPRSNGGEDLSLYLSGAGSKGVRPANFKLCIVRPAYRGNSLQFRLGALLERYAAEAGVGLMCATVHPRNIYSVRNLLRLGYVYDRALEKYGLERNLYYRFI